MIAFRPWQVGDVAALVKHASNPRVAANLKNRFPHPYTAADGERWIALNAAGPALLRSYAIDLDGEAIGGVLAERGEDVFAGTADVSYWVAEPFWGRSIGTAAARFISDEALALWPVVRLQAIVFEWNPASGRVLEKAGYVLEGRQRRAITKGDRIGDLLMYARLR